jgi:hypothetical protein
MVSGAASAFVLAMKEGVTMRSQMCAVLMLVAAVGMAATQAELQKEAKISMEKARAIALKKAPGGKIESAELEREHGKLIYSFDIKTSKPGVLEVNVDAINGKVISAKQETPAKEAAEKKQEAKEKH